MSARGGRRLAWRVVAGWVLLAVPAAAGAFLIYEKQRSMAEAASAPDRPAPSQTQPADDGAVVAIEPKLADPDILKRKVEQDALLRKLEAAAALKAARESALAAGASNKGMRSTGKSRASTIGPAPEPPEAALNPPAGDATPSAPASAVPGLTVPGAARFYGLEPAQKEPPPPPVKVKR